MIAFFVGILFFSSPKVNTEGQIDQPTLEQEQTCYVPCDDIVQVIGKDAISSIDDPTFIYAEHRNQPLDRDLVIGVVINGIPRAYSYEFLVWHEIVNDNIQNQYFSITYCPLTASSMVYSRTNLDNSELGVSGNLYENNLVFYDRTSETYWSQMSGHALKGEKIGENLSIIPSVETTWGIWKTMYPNTEALGVDSPYTKDTYDPYAHYHSDKSIRFRTSYNFDLEPYNLFHPKSGTTVIRINEKTKLLPYEKLVQFPVLNHQFEGHNMVTIYNNISSGILEAWTLTYSSTLQDGTELSFYSSYTYNPIGLPIFIDTSGSSWNIRGEAISGPHMGEKLEQVPTYNAYWFAAISFFHNASIFFDAGSQPTFDETSNIQIVQENSVENYSVSPIVQDTRQISTSLISIIPVFIMITYLMRKKKNYARD
jgi:hypothetical protein